MSKQTTIFNKGQRSFHLGDNVVLGAGETAKVDAKAAKKLMESYKDEIVLPRGEVSESNDAEVKALNETIATLTAELEEVKALNEELTAPATVAPKKDKDSGGTAPKTSK